MKIADLTAALADLAPPEFAEEWDNVGLLMGSNDAALEGPVLLTIDLTEAVAAEAVRRGASAVVSYHPPIFSPIKRLTGSTAQGRSLLALARIGAAVYSPHTALDAAPGGITDWLADRLTHGDASADRKALVPSATGEAAREVKIVTFVPESDVERVRAALASAGAGIIGKYEVCSFALSGTGTFRGGEDTKPAVGRAGHLESVPEIRLEMVCSTRALPLALDTLRQFHPYEEPAVDVYALVPKPSRGSGAGRRLTFDHPVPLRELASRLKSAAGVPAVQLALGAGVANTGHEVQRIALVPGAGASLLPAAIAEGCQAFITGEMKHHEVLDAVGKGVSVLLAGHTQTERGFLPVLAGKLHAALPGATFIVASSDTPPATWL